MIAQPARKVNFLETGNRITLGHKVKQVKIGLELQDKTSMQAGKADQF
jgi:hypothetical protein